MSAPFHPFLTIYTPTYKRPQGLARCLQSVGDQSIAHDIEHVVIPDHVGLGVGGMYKRVAFYSGAVHGKYVLVLADDDILASDTCVEEVREFCRANRDPDMVIVKSQKNGTVYPLGQPWPPVCGRIDLGCLVARCDVWRRHVQAYGHPGRYEGDFDFATAVWAAGHRTEFCDVLMVNGAVSCGVEEVLA